MKRRLFRIIIRSLTVLSLLLCVATCVLWVSGFARPHEQRWESYGVRWRAYADRRTFRVDNQPQLQLESDLWNGLLLKLQLKCQQRKSDSVQERDKVIEALSGDFSEEGERRQEEALRHSELAMLKAVEDLHQSIKTLESSREETKPVSFQIASSALLTITAIMPLFWIIIRIVRKFRLLPSPYQCRSCKYDVRATPDRCPECGAVPAK